MIPFPLMNHGFVIPSVGGETFFFSLRFLTWFRLFPFCGCALLTPILPCCGHSFHPLLFLVFDVVIFMGLALRDGTFLPWWW